MTGTTLTLLAPAKLNLFLHITGRRADGYHELQTLFQLLDYGDSLSFELAPTGVLGLHCDDPELPMDHNLIIQAAVALRCHAQSINMAVPGVDISLSKHIPSGAGLGGGSSNAASTLLALNRLWNLQLSQQKLCEIGLQLGADVPVFIGARSAWAEGVGELLQPVQIPPAWYLVVTPNCQVSTAEIFSHEQLTRDSSAIKMADFLAGLAQKGLAGDGHNDCEPITRKLYPEVDQVLAWLAQFGPARMTGTGASAFIMFKDAAAASSAHAALPSQWQGFIAKGLNSVEQV